MLSSSSPSSSADSGVLGAGLSTTGAPTAIAGATLWATRLSGKLNGLIASTGPLGTRRTYAIRPSAAASVSSRSTSPDCWRVSSAAQRKTDTARPTSPLAQNSGLPFSAVISSAISSARSWICRLTEASASARTWIGSRSASARTPSAAATAASTWALVAYVVVLTSEPSYGWCTSSGSSPCTHSPATSIGICSVTVLIVCGGGAGW